MNNDTQARAPARTKSWYVLGCAALLSLCCMPYRAAAQSSAAASTPGQVAERIVKAGERPKDAAPGSSSASQDTAAQRSHREREDAAPGSSSAPQDSAAQRSHRERQSVASAESNRTDGAVIAVESETSGGQSTPLAATHSVQRAIRAAEGNPRSDASLPELTRRDSANRAPKPGDSANRQATPGDSANRAGQRDPQSQALLREPTLAKSANPEATTSGASANRAAEHGPQATAPPSGPTALERADGRAEHAGAGRGVGVVNINTADAAELERLPRIGPTRAQAILALRAKLKQFSRIEQLLQVKGIGRATFRMLRPLLAISGPTTLEHKRGP